MMSTLAYQLTVLTHLKVDDYKNMRDMHIKLRCNEMKTPEQTAFD